MRIAHLEASDGWGGQEMRILSESVGLRERGHDIFMLVQKNGGLVAKAREKRFFVKEFYFQRRYAIFMFPLLLRFLRKNKIQLIVTHSSKDAWMGGIAAKLLGIPVLRMRHLSSRIRAGINSVVLYKWLADYVVTTCEHIVPIIKSQAKITKDICVSIPTGFDVQKQTGQISNHDSFRKKYSLKETDFLVGTVCFMRSWKGIDDLLQAAYLARKNDDIKWFFIGGGEYEIYRDKAIALQLKNVFFLGHLENPFPAIKALDIFSLLSTSSEGVSQASIQAAYHEKPLVCTPTGGLKEVCVPGQTGILVPLFSPQKVWEAVEHLRNNPKVRSEMGKNAKKLVMEKFTLEKMLDSMESVYQNLLTL